MDSDKVVRQHTVTCYQCGRQVTDLNRTKTQIRKELHDHEGWFVAIPAWAVHRGRRGDGKTVDCCDPCAARGVNEAMQRLAEANESAAARRLSTDKVQ